MRKALGIKKQNIIKKALKDALRSASMEHAGFGNGCNELPTNEDEVTEFIKERIKLYMDSWVIERIKAAINELTV